MILMNPNRGKITGGGGVLPRMLPLWLLLLSLSAGSARAEEVNIAVELYPLQGGALVYTAERTVRTEGGQITEKNTYRDTKGVVLVETEAVFDAATLEPVKYRYLDTRSGETETLDRQGGKAVMTYLKARGEKQKSGEEAMGAGKIISAAVTPFIQRNREALLAKMAMDFRLLVPNRQDSVGFRLMSDPEAKSPSGTFVIRMEASTWVIRQLVDPLYLILEDKPPYRLVEFRGRVAVKTNEGKDQDMRVVFKYP